jgi:hypothetical protein
VYPTFERAVNPWYRPRSPVIVNELRGILEGQKKAKDGLGDKYEDHGLVFCQRNGKPLHAHNITQRDFRRLI